MLENENLLIKEYEFLKKYDCYILTYENNILDDKFNVIKIKNIFI